MNTLDFLSDGSVYNEITDIKTDIFLAHQGQRNICESRIASHFRIRNELFYRKFQISREI